VLLAASYAFYWLVGGWRAVAVISVTALGVYCCGIWAAKLRESGADKRIRRLPIAVGLVLSFGIMALFKFGAGFGIVAITGISFYTFQAAGYLIDVYRGKAGAERNPLRFMLFVSFFPQLIQGPISRHSSVAEDLYAGHGFDWERARSGVKRIIWGYFLKLVIADRAAVLVNAVFSDYYSYGGAVILVSVLVYSVQIYADFAGGTGIALGIAEIVGVRLPENFRQPFFARSVTDFWRRWHITLGAWLKDYLFYPLALCKPLGRLGKLTRRVFGNRVGKIIPTSIATFAVYLVVGLWHGSSLKFVAFGLINGFVISLSLYCEPLIASLRGRTGVSGERGIGAVWAVVRTLGIVVFARYFSRAGSLMSALRMLKRTVFEFRLGELLGGVWTGFGLVLADYWVLIAAVSMLFIHDAIAERGGLKKEPNRAVQFAGMLVVLAALTVFGIYREGYVAAQFVYAQF
jgi:D-alanyl-lipoteichoic acid acyltransferase DltB (MBOAT superfamily)